MNNRAHAKMTEQIKQLHRQWVNDPALILYQLVDEYYQNRKNQPGGLLKGFFKNDSDSVFAFCEKLSKMPKPISIFDEINLLNQQLAYAGTMDPEFQNILNVFFSFYKNFLPRLDPAIQATLQLTDPLLNFLEILSIPQQMQCLEEKYAPHINVLASIAKLLPEKNREKIALAILEHPRTSSFQMDMLCNMENAIPNDLHPQLVDVIETFVTQDFSGDFIKDNVTYLEKFYLIIEDEKLRQKVRKIFSDKIEELKKEFKSQQQVFDLIEMRSSPSVFSSLEIYMNLLSLWGEKYNPADEKKSVDNTRNNLFQIQLKKLKEQKTSPNEFSVLLKDFFPSLAPTEQKEVIGILFEGAKQNSFEDARCLKEIVRFIPEEAVQELVASKLDSAKLPENFSFSDDELIDKISLSIAIISLFAENITDSTLSQKMVEIAFEHLKSAQKSNFRICIGLFDNIQILLGSNITDRTSKNILQIFLDMNAKMMSEEDYPLGIFQRMHEICHEAFCKLYPSATNSMREQIIKVLRSTFVNMDPDIQKSAAGALVRIAEGMNYSEAVQLISILETKAVTWSDRPIPAAIQALAKIVYEKECERLTQEQMLNPDVTKISVAKARS